MDRREGKSPEMGDNSLLTVWFWEAFKLVWLVSFTLARLGVPSRSLTAPRAGLLGGGTAMGVVGEGVRSRFLVTSWTLSTADFVFCLTGSDNIGGARDFNELPTASLAGSGRILSLVVSLSNFTSTQALLSCPLDAGGASFSALKASAV